MASQKSDATELTLSIYGWKWLNWALSKLPQLPLRPFRCVSGYPAAVTCPSNRFCCAHTQNRAKWRSAPPAGRRCQRQSPSHLGTLMATHHPVERKAAGFFSHRCSLLTRSPINGRGFACTSKIRRSPINSTFYICIIDCRPLDIHQQKIASTSIIEGISSRDSAHRPSSHWILNEHNLISSHNHTVPTNHY